ncbi:sugar phosphate isomerase/epimerase family protein [Mariniflexile sp.]
MMTINYFCPYWGNDHFKNEDFFKKIKDAGYDGVEFAIESQLEQKKLDNFWNDAEKFNAEIIVQHYDTNHSDYNKHYDMYAAWFDKISDYPCVKVNSQTGKDYFTFEQNKKLFDIASAFTQKKGIQVLHETHRNKFSFAAHITKIYLEKIKDLKLTLDISHWVNVAESFLEDQEAAVAIAISRTEHIHARVGFPEGPQISDPRAPEWKSALNHHLLWWDKVVALKKSAHEKELTITPEFGPQPYMPVLPYSQTPLSNQWDINVFMMDLLKKRYGS